MSGWGFFLCVFELLGGFFWLCFFSPLGPSLNSGNLTLNRATGIIEGGRGCSEGCRAGGTPDGSLEGTGNVKIFFELL